MTSRLLRFFASIPAKPFLLGYFGLYALMLWLLAKYQGYDPTDALFVLLALGGVLSSLAFFFTRRVQAPATVVKNPAFETGLLLAYLALFAFGVLGYGFTWLRNQTPDPRTHQLVLFAVKLLTMVALPALLLRVRDYRFGELLRWDLSWRRHGGVLAGMGIALLLFQALFGQGLKTLGALHTSPATLGLGALLCFAWLAVDTGLTEEFLFRVVLQTRLAALFRSETAGVLVMALLFGLAHAPGYYLRNAFAAEGVAATPSMLMSVGYSVVVTSVAGLMFGILWARTRSLVLVTVLHALTDLLPNLADFIRDWLRPPP